MRPMSMRRVVVLPAPFGPEQAEHLPVLDAERQVVDRAEPVGIRLPSPSIASGTPASAGSRRRPCGPARGDDADGDRHGDRREQGERPRQQGSEAAVAAEHGGGDGRDGDRAVAGQRDNVLGRLRGQRVRLVGGRDHEAQPVARRHVADHGRQAHRDLRAPARHAGELHGTDELFGQRRRSAGSHVVELGEQGRRAGGCGHAQAHPGGADDLDRPFERRRREHRRLARQRREPRGPARTAARPPLDPPDEEPPPPIAPAAALSAPSADPRPGSDVTAAGEPPAGTATGCGGPSSGTATEPGPRDR